MREVVLVGVGGALGAALRYIAGGWVHRLVPAGAFPWGTLAVNVVGCLAVGVLAGLAEGRGLLGPALRLFLLIGLLGGFTTYSTFAFETVALSRDAEVARAGANVVAHLVAGLGTAWLGLTLARLV